MKKVILRLLGGVLITSMAFARPAGRLKVLISVDMEGISGVVTAQECDPAAGNDYQYFRKIMSLEASAAVEGAFVAGATEVWVRDAHGSARNILPDLLDRRAQLIRDWSGGPKGMMEGIDETFDAALFIGYHAKAGTPDAIVEHTMTGRITDLKVNGISMPEAGLNALIGGYYNVPVIFVAGDKAICDQSKQLFGEVETVAVKEGMGGASIGLHPETAREKIKAGVERALKNLHKYRPYRLAPPYELVLSLKDEKMVHNGQFYPGVTRSGEWELSYRSEDIMEIIKAFEGILKQARI